MSHLPPLIQDLAVILITAAATTLIFRRLKQPVVLGYLVAGLLVGPHITFIPNIVDQKSIQVWAEIGVIFLLFGLGLEFSFKKLAQVGKSAGVAALFEIITMTGVGYLLGQALGWTKMDSLFLGTILSMSSTTIIIRAFSELGLKAKGFVSLVFGILIVEDLAAILILVLLTMIASPDPVPGSHVIQSTLRLGFFLLLWFLIGIYFVPVLLRKVQNIMSDETMLIVSIGLCLSMVLLATQVGFSPALGAFVMGSILAETREGKRIEHLMHPVRDLFAAIFFVSVGMMIDPTILKDNLGVVLLIIVVTIVGKLFGSGFGALLSGRSLRQSIQAGLSLAQIGEFSFLIAALGVTLGATSDFLYPVVIAVSAVTTFTTPYMIKFSDPVCTWLENRVPSGLKDRLTRYELIMNSESAKTGINLMLREYGPKLLLNSVVVIAISIFVSGFAVQKIAAIVGHSQWLRIGGCLLTLAVCSPFLRAIIMGTVDLPKLRTAVEIEDLRKLDFGIVVLRLIVGGSVTIFVIGQFASIRTLSGIILAAIGISIAIFSRFAEPIYRAIERRFLENLNASSQDEFTQSNKPLLAPWDATLAEFTVSPNSRLVGKRLEESALKELTGVTVAMIERGHATILAPDRKTMIMPFDRIFAIGSDQQLSLAQAQFESEPKQSDSSTIELYGLESLLLENKSSFVNKSIRECGLREMVNGLIVGIEREGTRILNPDSAIKLLPNDRIWVVGDRSRIRSLKLKKLADTQTI